MALLRTAARLLPVRPLAHVGSSYAIADYDWENEVASCPISSPEKPGMFMVLPKAVFNRKNISNAAKETIQYELNRRINVNRYFEPEKSIRFKMNFQNYGAYIQLDDRMPELFINTNGVVMSVVPQNGTIVVVRNGSIILDSNTGILNSIIEFD